VLNEEMDADLLRMKILVQAKDGMGELGDYNQSELGQQGEKGNIKSLKRILNIWR